MAVGIAVGIRHTSIVISQWILRSMFGVQLHVHAVGLAAWQLGPIHV